MELHLPYFALRTSPISQGQTPAHKPWRAWKDLSFLRPQATCFQGEQTYGMYEAQVSMIIYGSDHTRWTAYAFVDIEFDGEILDEKYNYFSYEGETTFIEDPIVDEGSDANLPIWDPRAYYLKVFKARITQICREWQNLICHVKRCIQKHRQHCTLSQGLSGTENPVENLKKILDFTRKSIELLSSLQHHLSSLIKEWETFSAPNGDIGYFVGMDVPQRFCHLAFREIKERFEVMQGLEQELLFLKTHCQESAQSVSRLILCFIYSEHVYR
jgi:hypothetical protein